VSAAHEAPNGAQRRDERTRHESNPARPLDGVWSQWIARRRSVRYGDRVDSQCLQRSNLLACRLLNSLYSLETTARLGLGGTPERTMPDKFHILHIEDDELDALNVQRFLRSTDHVSGITSASDGVDALAELRSGELSLNDLVVLLDIRLPRMDGFEFLRELRADPDLRHLPVVVLSTSEDEQDLATAYTLNVAGYLVKPLSVERLRSCLSSFARYWASQELV
jgi:CheY-like chemotaxis protein